ncbi:MAG TPA: response regulator [Stellaceae bacterium]|nr:response regulator [Stellaceae bacterium]
MKRICRVLVVEDNDGIRDFLHALFADEGYHITIVAGGEEMRAALTKDRFDVALIDVTLPGADDGFALAKLASAAGCGIILVTGNARHFEAVKASGHRYLLKPFRVERLLVLVNELIAEAKDCAPMTRPAGS